MRECGVDEATAEQVMRAFLSWRTQRQQWQHQQNNLQELERLRMDSRSWSQRRVTQLEQSIARRCNIIAGHDPDESHDHALQRILRSFIDQQKADDVFSRFVEWRNRYGKENKRLRR